MNMKKKIKKLCIFISLFLLFITLAVLISSRKKSVTIDHLIKYVYHQKADKLFQLFDVDPSHIEYDFNDSYYIMKLRDMNFWGIEAPMNFRVQGDIITVMGAQRILFLEEQHLSEDFYNYFVKISQWADKYGGQPAFTSLDRETDMVLSFHKTFHTKEEFSTRFTDVEYDELTVKGYGADYHIHDNIYLHIGFITGDGKNFEVTLYIYDMDTLYMESST